MKLRNITKWIRECRFYLARIFPCKDEIQKTDQRKPVFWLIICSDEIEVVKETGETDCYNRRGFCTSRSIFFFFFFWDISFILRRPRVANFADIIKIVTMLIRKTFKESKKKLKELQIMYENAIYIWIFWCRKIWWFSIKNVDVSRVKGLCRVIHIFLGSSLGKV